MTMSHLKLAGLSSKNINKYFVSFYLISVFKYLNPRKKTLKNNEHPVELSINL